MKKICTNCLCELADNYQHFSCETCNKPKVKLADKDGNAFTILGACTKAAKKAGWDSKKIDEFISNATKGDYYDLLATAQEYFDVH